MAQSQGVQPAYRRLADDIIREIEAGRRAPASRLPTVRQLALESGLAQGTVKHVYDVLEAEGFVVKEQGRGTFVRRPEAPPTGDKARAMQAIDALLDDMAALGFSWQETRIFLDLKLRQREEGRPAVRIAAVDCNPEALAMMREQIETLPHAEVEIYGLEAVLGDSRPFEPRADIAVTTTTHGDQLDARMAQPVIRLVMDVDTETAVALAALPESASVAIVCKSERFAGIVLESFRRYCPHVRQVEVAHFGRPGQVAQVAERCDVLVLAPHYPLFADTEELTALRAHGGSRILYRYRVELGSMVYLESQVAACWRSRGE